MTGKYDQIDLDILVVAYAVHAIVKNGPRMTPGMTKTYETYIEHDLAKSLEKQLRRQVTRMVDRHVKNKGHFHQVLDDAQWRRNYLRNKDKPWFKFTLPLDPNDV